MHRSNNHTNSSGHGLWDNSCFIACDFVRCQWHSTCCLMSMDDMWHVGDMCIFVLYVKPFHDGLVAHAEINTEWCDSVVVRWHGSICVAHIPEPEGEWRGSTMPYMWTGNMVQRPIIDMTSYVNSYVEKAHLLRPSLGDVINQPIKRLMAGVSTVVVV